uniref:CRM1_C domain-containing protein n=1 Tax=Parastrongyloides trichosuri TaxID=131310 RepID=A0A0N4Z4E6_PARTI
MENSCSLNGVLLNENDFLNALQIFVDGSQGDSVVLAGKYIEECITNKVLFVEWTSKVIMEYLHNPSSSRYNLKHVGFLFQMLRLCLIKDPFNFEDSLKEKVVNLGLLCSKESYKELAKDPSVISQFNTIMNAFCCYYLVVPHDTNFIENFGDWFLSGGDNYEFLYLSGLNYLFEEMRNKKLPVGDNRRNSFNSMIAEKISDFVNYIFAFLQRVPTYSKYYNRVIEYSANIMKNDKIAQDNPEFLRFIEFILGLIFNNDVPDETLTVACDFIMDLMYVIERSYDSFISMGTINNYVNEHFGYVVELSKLGDSGRLRSICKMLVEKAEASRFDIVDNLGNQHETFKNFSYINFIAQLGVEYADITLSFWGEITEAVLQIMDDLEEHDLVKRTNIQSRISEPLKEYYKILITQMVIDEDQPEILTADQDEELHTFRNNVVAIIGETSNIVGVTNTLNLFGNWLREHSHDWRMTEAIILMISALGYDVVQYMEYEHNEYVLNMIKQLMNGSPNMHPQMTYTILECIKEFIEVVAVNLEAQQITLRYISSYIADQRYSYVCCKIFETLVERGKLYNIDCLELFLQLPNLYENALCRAYQNELNIQTILCALSLMISQNFKSENFVYLLRLLEVPMKRLEYLNQNPQNIPHTYYGKYLDHPWKTIENDPCVYFHRITSVTRNLVFSEIVIKFPELKENIHSLELQLWRTMQNILGKLKEIKQIDNATRVIRVMLRQGSSLFKEISIEMLRLFLECKHYPFMYIVSVAIDTHGDDLMKLPEFYTPLKSLITICIENLIPEEKTFTQLIEVVDDFYRLIKKLINKNKEFFLSLEHVDRIIDVAIKSLEVEEISEYECHIDTIALLYEGLKDINKEDANLRMRYITKLNEYMQSFLNGALHAIIFKLYRLKRSSPVCEAIYSVFRYDKDQFFKKFQVSLDNIPNMGKLGADEEQKKQFIYQLQTIETKHWSKHQFVQTFHDFANYYN